MSKVLDPEDSLNITQDIIANINFPNMRILIENLIELVYIFSRQINTRIRVFQSISSFTNLFYALSYLSSQYLLFAIYSFFFFQRIRFSF